jgi:N-acylneuraminate cytidylyltransferase
MTVLAVITARGGSVRLPGKNIMPLDGVPLIGWTIRAARAARSIDRVVVTTDDEAIANVARAEGAEVPFMRPPDLATATASSLDAVLHCVHQSAPTAEMVVLLQPTSPLRTAQDIDAVTALVTAGAPAAVSVRELPFKWDTMVARDESGATVRPTFSGPPPTHALNGAVYAIRRTVLEQERTFLPGGVVSYVMPAERSIDVDTIDDFRAVEAALAHQRR